MYVTQTGNTMKGTGISLSEMSVVFDSLESKYLSRVLCPIPEAKSNLAILP